MSFRRAVYIVDLHDTVGSHRMRSNIFVSLLLRAPMNTSPCLPFAIHRRLNEVPVKIIRLLFAPSIQLEKNGPIHFSIDAPRNRYSGKVSYDSPKHDIKCYPAVRAADHHLQEYEVSRSSDVYKNGLCLRVVFILQAQSPFISPKYQQKSNETSPTPQFTHLFKMASNVNKVDRGKYAAIPTEEAIKLEDKAITQSEDVIEHDKASPRRAVFVRYVSMASRNWQANPVAMLQKSEGTGHARLWVLTQTGPTVDPDSTKRVGKAWELWNDTKTGKVSCELQGGLKSEPDDIFKYWGMTTRSDETIQKLGELNFPFRWWPWGYLFTKVSYLIYTNLPILPFMQTQRKILSVY